MRLFNTPGDDTANARSHVLCGGNFDCQSAPPPPPTIVTMSATVGLSAVAEILEDSGIFASILLGQDPPHSLQPEEPTPRAWIRPVKWSTLAADDGEYDEQRIRLVTYEVELATRDGEGLTLDELAEETAGLLHQAELPHTLPEANRCDDLRWLRTPGAEHRATLTGTFAYEIGEIVWSS